MTHVFGCKSIKYTLNSDTLHVIWLIWREVRWFLVHLSCSKSKIKQTKQGNLRLNRPAFDETGQIHC